MPFDKQTSKEAVKKAHISRNISTEINKAKYLTLLEKNYCRFATTAREMGLHSDIHLDWIAKDEKFAEAVESLKKALTERIEIFTFEHLFNNIKLENQPTLIFTLKTQANWVEPDKTTEDSNINLNVTYK